MLATELSTSSTSDPLERETWATWLAAIVPQHCTARFAAHHVEFWEWVEKIRAGEKPDEAFVGIWARGGAKSTSAEAATVKLGAQRRRRYCWYVSGTQELADKHVETIAAMVEGDRFEMFYPEMAQRAVGKYGSSKGWRRNRLRCANGFTIDAVGLDGGARGVKVEDQRPDLIVLDDVDDTEDSIETTAKKIRAITRKLLPAGSADVAVIAIQNVVHPNSVFARLADGRAEFLARRHVSGPIPAVANLTTEAELHEGKIRHRVTGGEPTWEGQGLAVVQDQIDDWGFAAFLSEAQHEARVDGALWCREQLNARRASNDGTPLALHTIVTHLERVVTGVDPAGSSGPDADDTGIVVAGRTGSTCPACGPVQAPHAFVLADRTVHDQPGAWAQAAIDAHDNYEGDTIVAETNNGHEMVAYTIRSVDAAVPIAEVHASRGKRVRAEPIAALYGNPEDESTWPLGRVHHFGAFSELEEQMCTWRPGLDSPDRLDALVWALTDLMLGEQHAKMRYRGAA